MAGKALQSELQDNLGRSRRPSAFALDVIQPLEKTADIEKQASHFRADAIEGLMNLLARRDHNVGYMCAAKTASATPYDNGIVPVRRRTRHQMCSCEIGPQSLASLKLMWLDQYSSITAAAAR